MILPRVVTWSFLLILTYYTEFWLPLPFMALRAFLSKNMNLFHPFADAKHVTQRPFYPLSLVKTLLGQVAPSCGLLEWKSHSKWLSTHYCVKLHYPSMKIALQSNNELLVEENCAFVQAFLPLSAWRTPEGRSLTLPPSPMHSAPKPFLTSSSRAHGAVGKAAGSLLFFFDQSNCALPEVSFSFECIAQSLRLNFSPSLFPNVLCALAFLRPFLWVHGVVGKDEGRLPSPLTGKTPVSSLPLFCLEGMAQPWSMKTSNLVPSTSPTMLDHG